MFAAYLIPGTILGIGTLVAVSFSDEDVFKDPNDWSLGPLTLGCPTLWREHRPPAVSEDSWNPFSTPGGARER